MAQELIDEGCILISQHSDTTGPAVACESAGGEIPVYHVGYNQSMLDVAPTRSLVSCSVDYSMYFEQSVGAVLNGKNIEDQVDASTYGQDTFAGIDRGWVRILDYNEAVVAEGTKQKVEEMIAGFEIGDVHVVYGVYTGTDPFDETDRIDLSTEYVENEQSSSPTFHYILDDVIQELP